MTSSHGRIDEVRAGVARGPGRGVTSRIGLEEHVSGLAIRIGPGSHELSSLGNDRVIVGHVVVQSVDGVWFDELVINLPFDPNAGDTLAAAP